MRILFTNQLYGQGLSSGHNLYELAQYLVKEAGHEVHVLCGLAGYDGSLSDLPSSQLQDGVHVHRTRWARFGKAGMAARLADYSAFMLATLRELLHAGRYDVIVNLTDPPVAPWAGTLMSRIYGVPQIIWCMDVHPDAMLELGLISPGNPAARMAVAAARASFTGADAVAAVGRCMRERLIANGCSPERVQVITVWNDRNELLPLEREANPLRRELGLNDETVFMYSGNIGLMHEFQDILDAARIFQDRRDIVFLFVGQGRRFTEIEAFQKKHSLPNLLIRPYFPRERLRESLSVGDVHLITLREKAVGVSVPGKLYSAMAVARPVFFIGSRKSEVALTLDESSSGLCIRPGDVAGLTQEILKAVQNRAALETMGRAGRREFEAKYEREVCCRSWAELIENTAQAGGRRRGRP